MQYRGSLGEALIHILIMGNSLIHTKIARTLIRHFPNTVIDVIEVMMIDGHRTKFIAWFNFQCKYEGIQLAL